MVLFVAFGHSFKVIKYLISSRDLIPRVGEQDHLTPPFGLLDESSANVVD